MSVRSEMYSSNKKILTVNSPFLFGLHETLTGDFVVIGTKCTNTFPVRFSNGNTGVATYTQKNQYSKH